MILRSILGGLLAAWTAQTALAQGSRVCGDCHPKILETYRQTGMGRSFYRPTAENTAASGDNTYYHKASDTYFTMFRRAGGFFQRGYQLDSGGKPTNVTEKRVDYVLGSGNHARTYLSETGGPNDTKTLVELPLGWYAEKGGYLAMNPGYDRADHDGFRRPITYDCMFCHNAYPGVPARHEQPLADPVYAGALPEGIDCQRCHGSGARHMQLAAAGGAGAAIGGDIVNPARLSAERQLEGCMVCHLETTSFPLPNALQRYQRGAFSYRPGEPLGGFLINFDHAPEAGRDDKFELVNAPYRLRRSACFLKSNGRMLCTTCHDPHQAPRGEEADRHYTAVCRECHGQAFERLVEAKKHTSETGCAGCHMPKRRTGDVIHVVATDHLIQRGKPLGDLLAARAERQDVYRGRVALYYPETLPHGAENDLTLAVAQVIQGSNLTEGIAQLTAAIEKYQPERPEYYLELAEALRKSGQAARALPVYREAVRRKPEFGPGLQKLGTALRRSGEYAEALAVLRRAALLEPGGEERGRAVAWHELGLTYQAMGRSGEAVEAIGRALRLDPELPEAHNNLGIIRLEHDQQAAAEAAFREAIRIRPGYADAHGNLAGLLSAAGRLGESREEFESALRLRPADSLTRYNYAMMLGRTGRFDAAQRELTEALRANADFVDAHLLLGDLLMAKQQAQDAAPHYREALRMAPDSGRGHFGLGAALVAAGDVAGAIPHLRKAAADVDAGTRGQAEEMLRRVQGR